MSNIFVDEKNALFQKQQEQEISKLQIFITGELILLLFIGIIFANFNSFFQKQTLAYEHPLTPMETKDEPVVLGASTDIFPTPTITNLTNSTNLTNTNPTPTTEPFDSAQGKHTTTPPPTKSHSKSSYSIAVYGDSMVDTMGERLEYLEHSLTKLYPGVNFTLYNYGKGSENAEMGLNRWNNKLDYQDRHYPSIVDVKPDIIIMGSFAYNPFSPYIRDRHWTALTKLIEAAKIITPNVYALAEINPLRKDFGKGPNGVNWDENTAFTHSGHIVEQLENAVSLSKNLNVGLIDVFHASIGKIGLNNPGDGIHASVFGHEFTADIIAKTINLN